LGLDIICFVEERWADASSLRIRTAEILQTFSRHQRSAFELMIAGHTQKEIADKLGKSQSWAGRQVRKIRAQFLNDSKQ
jgi:FixJ family two-component response regulator